MVKIKPMWIAAAGLVLGSAHATGVPGPVVGPQWLHDHLDDVTVLDVRTDVDQFTRSPSFETDGKTGIRTLDEVGGHIGPALLVDFSKIRVTRKIGGKDIKAMLPDKAQFTDLMQAVGLNAGKPIVITSNGQSVDDTDMATRLYWSLKYYGVDDMAVLDGGDAAWINAGFPMSSAPAATANGTWTATAERKALLATSADVEKAAAQRIQLVDARPLQQYLGITYKKPIVAAGGHLKGAKSLPTDVQTRSDRGAALFLSAAEYRSVMKTLGVNDKASTITYCNTGHLASGAWFVMSEIVGNRHVRLYDGSLHEWTTEGRPVVGLK